MSKVFILLYSVRNIVLHSKLARFKKISSQQGLCFTSHLCLKDIQTTWTLLYLFFVTCLMHPILFIKLGERLASQKVHPATLNSYQAMKETDATTNIPIWILIPSKVKDQRNVVNHTKRKSKMEPIIRVAKWWSQSEREIWRIKEVAMHVGVGTKAIPMLTLADNYLDRYYMNFKHLI